MKCLVVLWLDWCSSNLRDNTAWESEWWRTVATGWSIGFASRCSIIAHETHPSTQKSFETKRCRCVNVYTFKLYFETFADKQLVCLILSSLCDNVLARLRQSNLGIERHTFKGLCYERKEMLPTFGKEGSLVFDQSSTWTLFLNNAPICSKNTPFCALW